MLYNRFHAYLRAHKDKLSRNFQPVVPQINSTQHKENSASSTTTSRHHRADHSEQYCSHQPITITKTSTSLSSEMSPLDSEIERFASIEPQLVFLCQRGYNHCAGKLSSRSMCKQILCATLSREGVTTQSLYLLFDVYLYNYVCIKHTH